jgi:hypothetical protein
MRRTGRTAWMRRRLESWMRWRRAVRAWMRRRPFMVLVILRDGHGRQHKGKHRG